MKLFQSTLEAKIIGDFFHFYHSLLYYPWPSSPPVTLKMKTACSLLFMEIHQIWRNYPPFSPNCSISISSGKDYAILCLGSSLLTCYFAIEFRERWLGFLHWLYRFLYVG